MYTLAISVQYLGVGIMLWGFYRVYSRKVSVQKQLLLLTLSAILVNQMGYALELGATTQDAALVSIKIAYFGKLIALYGMFMFVMTYCKVQIPRWGQHCMLALILVILVIVWTCEKHTLYYTSISFTNEGLYPHVVLGHGIFYVVFMVQMFVYLLIMFWQSGKHMLRARTQIERTRMLFMMALSVFFISGILIFWSGITEGYDTTALANIFSSIIMLVALEKYDLINEEELAKEIIIDQLDEAVLVLNNKGVVCYINSRYRKLMEAGAYDSAEALLLDVKKALQEKQEYVSGASFYIVQKEDIVIEAQVMGEIYMLHDVSEYHRHMELIENYNSELEQAVAQKTKHLERMQDQLVLGMADMVENRDPYTGGHIKRTSRLAKILVDEIKKDPKLGLDDKFCDYIVKAAPMHDLGKITIDDDILKKPGRYTMEEFDIMKQHAEMGGMIVHQLLEGIEDDLLASVTENIAHYHHESFDGTGYPDHLKGEEIPIEARIIAIVDVYDALVSKRSYKEKLSFDVVDQIIMDGMGTRFDSRFKDAYVASRDAFEAYYMGLEKERK